MPDIGESYSETGFQRQRRNLIIGSIALLFIQVAELRLEPRGTILGWTFQVGRPDAVMWFLWTAVCYWLLRFYQYHQWRRPTELQSAARTAMGRYLEARALKNLLPQPPILEKPVLAAGQTARLNVYDFRLRTIGVSRIEATFRAAWAIRLPDGAENEQRAQDHRGEFHGRTVWIARILGYTNAVLTTPYFTEYTLPYLVFLLPVAWLIARL